MRAVTELPSDAPTISVAKVVALFACGYGAVVFAVAVLPVNLMLAHFFPAGTGSIWTRSMLRLGSQMAIAALACIATLYVARRTGGRIQGRGFLAPGSLLSGALAGAVEVAIRPRLLHVMAITRARSPVGAELIAAVLSVCVVSVATSLLIVRGTRIARS